MNYLVEQQRNTTLPPDGHPRRRNNSSGTPIPPAVMITPTHSQDSTFSLSENDPPTVVELLDLVSENADGRNAIPGEFLSKLLRQCEEDDVTPHDIRPIDALAAALRDLATARAATPPSASLQQQQRRESDYVALEAENAKLKEQKAKIIGNNRKQRAMLEEGRKQLNAMQAQLKQAREASRAIEAERDMATSNLSAITITRDDLKQKLRNQREACREAKAAAESAERRLEQAVLIRAKERELLGLYRQLSLHTGYYRWGKAIRVLEAEWTTLQEQEDRATTPSV